MIIQTFCNKCYSKIKECEKEVSLEYYRTMIHNKDFCERCEK